MRYEIDKKGPTWFLALTFIPTIAVSLILRNIGVDLADKMMAYYSVALAAAMFFPGISAFIVRKFINQAVIKEIP
jgi:hypothetical protein